MQTLYKYLAILAIAVGTGLAAYSWHKAEVKIAVEATKAAVEQTYRVALDEQRKRLTARSEASEKALGNQVAKLQKEKRDAQTKNAARTESVASGVRDEIASGSVRSDLTCGATIGADPSASNDLRLSGPDAEILTKWFAGTATELQAQLKFCSDQYNAVKEEFDSFKDSFK